jgi:uncharacterized protein
MTVAASAITVFRSTGDSGGFELWLRELVGSAQSADGYIAARTSAHDDPRLEPALEVTFDSEDRLHAWLDSPVRKDLVRQGESSGYWQRTSDLVFVQDSDPPAGVGAFLHNVALGKEADFAVAQANIAAATATFPGSEWTVLFPPTAGDEWMSVVRFRTGHQLAGWMRSQQRADALTDVRAVLTQNFSEVARTTPFGSTVRTDDGRTRITPGWKVAMIVVVGLYPMAMLLTRYVVPVLEDDVGMRPWLSFFTSNVLSVALLQWLLIPLISRAFRRWLDPIDGSGLRVGLIGAGVVVLLYVVFIAIFASVKSIQYWDYAS